MGEGDIFRSGDGGAQYLPVGKFADTLDVGGRSKRSMTSQDVSGFIGKSITLPSGWSREEKVLGGHRTMTTFSSPTDDAQLSLYDRGLKVRDQSAKYFTQLLSDSASITGPKVLLPQQIRDLADVMGMANAGDNQFTNSYTYPDPKSPAFHLSSAQMVPLNGHVVLEVQGNYFDQSGKPGMQYRGIFVSTGSDGATVKEFFLQAKSSESFAKHQKEYREALNSIKW